MSFEPLGAALASPWAITVLWAEAGDGRGCNRNNVLLIRLICAFS